MSGINRTNFVLLVVTLVGGFTPHVQAQGRPVTAADQAAGQAWWAHVKALADDGMEGRLTGSEGYLRAAKYVVSKFDAMGLQPAGVNGYYQPVRFDVIRVIADKSSMTLLIDGRKEPLVLGMTPFSALVGHSRSRSLLHWSSSVMACTCPKRSTTISIRLKCPFRL